MAGLLPDAAGLEGSDAHTASPGPDDAIACQAMSASDPSGARVSDRRLKGRDRQRWLGGAKRNRARPVGDAQKTPEKNSYPLPGPH